MEKIDERDHLVVLSGSERGGVVQGFTPIHSEIQLYLVQIILIVVMCFILGQLVKKWGQPRVIAEVSPLCRPDAMARSSATGDGDCYIMPEQSSHLQSVLTPKFV